MGTNLEPAPGKGPTSPEVAPPAPQGGVPEPGLNPAESAASIALGASAEQAAAQGSGAGLQELAWGTPEPAGTTGVKPNLITPTPDVESATDPAPSGSPFEETVAGAEVELNPDVARISESMGDIKALLGNLAPEQIASDPTLTELAKYDGGVEGFVGWKLASHALVGTTEVVTPAELATRLDVARERAISILGKDRSDQIIADAREKQAAEVDSTSTTAGPDRETQAASIETSLREGEAQLNALEQSGASKDAIAAAQRNLEVLEQQRKDLLGPPEPSQAAETGEQIAPTTEAETVGAAEPQEPAPDKNLPIADRLSSARSVRDTAEQALDSYSGTDVSELRELERTFRKAESEYRDLQSESDRALAEQRLSSMEDRLNQTFKDRFGSLENAMKAQREGYEESVKNLALAIKAKTKKEEEGFLIKALAALGIAAAEALRGADVGGTIQKPAGAGRTQ